MATRKGDVAELVARVRRVGWPVERNTDGAWRVTCPDSFRVQIHLTPSDRNGTTAAHELLVKHGFAEAEAAALEAEELARKEKLDADRRANDRRLARAESQAASLARAAGPYAAVQPTLDEILQDHPAPRVWLKVHITKGTADAMLERNTHNRAESVTEQRDWEEKLRTGRVAHTHQGIAFDALGRLIDGQTRLRVISTTGIGADMMVSVGWPTENFAVADSGRRRTAGQILGIAGAKSAAAVAGAIRVLWLHQIWGPSTLDHARQTVNNDVVATMYDKLDKERLVDAVTWAGQLRREIQSPLAGPIAGLYLIGSAMPPADERVKTFVGTLIEGARQPDGDPVAALRRQLIGIGRNRKMTGAHQAALIIKAWNAHMQGGTSRYMHARAGTKMPAVYVPEN